MDQYRQAIIYAVGRILQREGIPHKFEVAGIEIVELQEGKLFQYLYRDEMKRQREVNGFVRRTREEDDLSLIISGLEKNNNFKERNKK